MDFFDFAKEIERQGAHQYAVLAETMPVRELSGIFSYMKEQENRHYELFDSWQHTMPSPPLAAETVLGKAKEAFKRIADHFMTNHYFPPINYRQAYEKALEFEKKSIALYDEGLTKIENRDHQTVLKLILDQEKAHARFLTSLMEFERSPGEWLENAEWYHLDEY